MVASIPMISDKYLVPTFFDFDTKILQEIKVFISLTLECFNSCKLFSNVFYFDLETLGG